jgi:hypothetical protein
VLADDTPVLAQFDPVGVGTHLHRAADGAGLDRVLVVVEAHEAGLGHRGLGGMEAVEAAAIGHQARPLLLEDLPDRLAGDLRMGLDLCPRNALVEQPVVELLHAPDPHPRREQPLADRAHLVLDLPARHRRSDRWRNDSAPQPDAGVQATGSTR